MLEMKALEPLLLSHWAACVCIVNNCDVFVYWHSQWKEPSWISQPTGVMGDNSHSFELFNRVAVTRPDLQWCVCFPSQRTRLYPLFTPSVLYCQKENKWGCSNNISTAFHLIIKSNCCAFSGVLAWLDSSDVSYSNWVNLPDDQAACAHVLRHSGFQWEATENCSQEFNFICQFGTRP